MIFKEEDMYGRASSVTILEFKRPDRIDKDILNQIFEYLDELTNINIQTGVGRSINTTPETIYYCYAICDLKKLDSEIRLMAKRGDYKKLRGNMGYYTYNCQYNAHIEILSYDKLLPDAKIRNWVWFDKLGLNIHLI